VSALAVQSTGGIADRFGAGTQIRETSTVLRVFCHNCGHRNPGGVNFCSSCGAALANDVSETTITLQPVDEHGESPDEEPTVTLVEVPRGQGVLVVKRGPNVGTRYTLEGAVTRAGRHPESDIFLDDITVSRRHAELERQANGSIVIRDDGSLNGTYVNRERIEEQTLTGGDEVQIGKFKLVYLVAGEE
jgi:FHA domain/zinc-ribbon domain